MLYNYFKTAMRNLWKNKGFSAINIVGLAIGLATCLLILIFVMDELSYDRWNTNADRIYRLDGDIQFGGKHFILAQSPAPAGPTLLREYPEVLKEVRFRKNGGYLVRKGNQNFKEEAVIQVDSTLFDVFSLPMIAGDPHTALKEARSVVLTETMARKYFEEMNVVGRTLMINDSIPYRVTGVIRDIPAQSHFHFDFFLSLDGSAEAKRFDDAWLSNSFTTYVVLRSRTDARKFGDKLSQGLISKYIGPMLHLDKYIKAGNSIGYSLTPLTSIHLYSNKTGELDANGNIQYVYIFSAIAAFILLIACVNFMNLSTARSANRAKEVGIRKVLGSLRGNLIAQFIMESVVISFVAMVLAVGLAYALLPLFNQLSAKHMEIGLFSRAWLAPAMLVLVLIVGLLAGSYPAFFLSAFRPILVLKGKVAVGFKTSYLRNSLVVFQFGISIFLLVGTAVIYRQLQYIHSRELGFTREQVMVINDPYVMGDQARTFRDKLLNLPEVKGATMTGYLPTAAKDKHDVIFLSPEADVKKSILMQTWPVDDQYIPVLGMTMAEGRNFSKDLLTDSNAVILNEAAAHLLQGKKPLESSLYEATGDRPMREYHIIGVVKDFNFSSLREVVTPVMLFLGRDQGRIALRVQSAAVHRLLGQIGGEWQRMASAQPFSYSFMDEEFNNIYLSEQRLGGISLSFSLLAIFVACLGLFGLTAFAAEQRTREIGIRKVLGATVGGIIRLLSRDFVRLVLLAMFVSFPIAWWVMHRWLQDFAYRITIGWEVFAMAALAALGIALLTVSFQAVRAALADPVKSLRSE